MAFKVNINGRIVDSEEAQISVLDHGFLFGDSVYEVVRTYGRKPFCLAEHIERLRKSAAQISLDTGLTLEEWDRRIARTLEAAANDESYIRIVVTRGVGDVNLDPSTCLSPSHILLVQPFPPHPSEYFEQGIKIVFVNIQRNATEALSPQIKSGNYLNNLLALLEAKRQNAQEGIMLNTRKFVTEGTTSNIFIVRDSQLKTPSLSSGILEGITRKIVFQIADELSIPVQEGEMGKAEVEEADEVFITSTTREIMPVRLVGDREIKSPGEITGKLRQAFEKRRLGCL